MSRPLIAILRGIEPHESVSISGALLEAGITRIEVPLNSRDPFTSISNIIKEFSDRAEIGAGTVLHVEQVRQLAKIGGKMVVSPNCNYEVIRETKKQGMKSYPGVLTPTECFQALQAGADGLKIFPASIIGPEGLTAIRSVLPIDLDIFAVGGVSASNLDLWTKAGASGFGIGSSLYRPGDTAITITDKAIELVDAFDSCSLSQ